jgi:putative hydrolase of the HAD superfamily
VISAVVFDIDDTLYLERDYVRSGFAAAGAWASERLGVHDLADRAWAAFVAGRRATIFDEVLAGYGVRATPPVVAGLVESYRSHVPAIALLPDAGSCLDAITRTSRLAAAVVTDGPLASQRAKAEALGLERWVDPIVFTEALGPGWAKPAPHAFELVQDTLGAVAAEFRVRRPGGLHHDRASGADVTHEAADLTGLLDWLDR